MVCREIGLEIQKNKYLEKSLFFNYVLLNENKNYFLIKLESFAVQQYLWFEI